MTIFVFANFFSTTLSSSVASGNTTINLASVSGAPTIPSGQQWAIVVQSASTPSSREVMYVTSITGNTLTVTRAQEGTSAGTWSIGDYVIGTNTAGQMTALLQRIKLYANLSLYVSTTGNDNNPGTESLPFATLQGAWGYIVTYLDLGGFDVTVNVANGTYAPVTCAGIPTGFSGSSSVSFVGNTSTPTDVIISASASNTPAVLVTNGANVQIEGFEVEATSGSGLLTQAGGILTISGNMTFGSCSGTGNGHIYASQDGIIFISSGYTVSGSAYAHYIADGGQMFTTLVSFTLTVPASTALTFTYFAYALLVGAMQIIGLEYSDGAGSSVTGARYSAITNGVINTNGGGADYFEGTSAGSTASGGQYV